MLTSSLVNVMESGAMITTEVEPTTSPPFLRLTFTVPSLPFETNVPSTEMVPISADSLASAYETSEGNSALPPATSTPVAVNLTDA